MHYLLLTRNNTANNAVFTNGLVTRADATFRNSYTPSTTLAALDVATTGIKATFVFQLRFNEELVTYWRLRFRIKWEIALISAGAAQMRVNLDLQKNATAIPGFTKVNGPARLTNALSTYDEINMIADMTSLGFVRGDTLDVRIELETTTIAAGGNPNIRVYHDNAGTANEMGMEVDAPLSIEVT